MGLLHAIEPVSGQVDPAALLLQIGRQQHALGVHIVDDEDAPSLQRGQPGNMGFAIHRANVPFFDSILATGH
ncbi:hypothetical protein D3C77_616360 [compost metagenome]